MTYVIDANAIIALLNDEPGADVVEKLLATSDHHELEPLAQAGVCKINFFR